MAHRGVSKQKPHSRQAMIRHRRRAVGLTAAISASLTFGLGLLAHAPQARADEFDVVMDQVLNAITGSLGDVAAGPAAVPELGSLAAVAATPADSWLHGLEQDWINSALGQQVDTALTTWLNHVDPATDACGLTCNSADGDGGSTLAQANPAEGAAVTNTDTVTATNGVTGVKTGFSFLDIPVGTSGYDAPTHWYFPTQADGSVDAHGVIYLQHGFGAIGWFYQPLAMQLAKQTDSIVVVPTVSSFPSLDGAWLNGEPMQQAVAKLFLGSETALNISANQAGYQGTLPVDFIMTGHSAGGGLATIAAGDYVADLGGDTADNHLNGVVMFDGVSINSSAFAGAIANLQSLDIPDYVVAAPPQLWNALGATTNELVSLYPDQFVGAELVNGSHVDALLGDKPFIDFFAQLVTRFSPPGNTAAVYTLSSGWINDMYAGAGPDDPIYGVYGPTGDYVPPGGQQIILGQAGGIVLPV